MKACTSALLLPLAVLSLAGIDCLAQPWSLTASNTTPKAAAPANVSTWTEGPTTATPVAPPRHPVHVAQTPVFNAQPLTNGVLAFDAEQKEFTLEPGKVDCSFVFYVTNISSSDVTITYVQPSCGCTTTRLQLPMKLAVNQTGEIPINMNVAGKVGTVAKTLTIHSDKGQKVLLVKAIIPAVADNPLTMGANRERNQQLAMADRQAVFKGDCARCHVEPVIGKTGKELYTAACGICHEAEHRASMVTDLHNLKTPPNAEYWKFFIVNGKPGTLMPAFSQSQGGPLSDAQVASLVEYLVKEFPKSKTNPPAHASAH
jgi:mono/diheme cytochrome c family protein